MTQTGVKKSTKIALSTFSMRNPGYPAEAARAGNGGITFSPPLCITRDEVDRIVHAIDLSLGEVESDLGISKS